MGAGTGRFYRFFAVYIFLIDGLPEGFSAALAQATFRSTLPQRGTALPFRLVALFIRATRFSGG
jgi:hypothetical protein